MLDFERIEKMLKGRVAVKKEFEKEFMVNKEKLDEILSSPIDGDTFRKSLTCCIHKILDDIMVEHLVSGVQHASINWKKTLIKHGN